MTFKDLLIKPELIDALQVQNITQPTQIQCKAAKPVFDGRDMIACSSTGSGKTLAYLLLSYRADLISLRTHFRHLF